MIFNAISSFVLGLFALVLTILPDANGAIVSDIESGVEPFRVALASANWFFPVGTFFSFVGLMLAIELILFVYKIMLWLLENVSIGFFKN